LTPKTLRRPTASASPTSGSPHGDFLVWSHFLRQQRFRQQLREVLPHNPSSPNAYDPTKVALGYVGGFLGGANKISHVAWPQSEPAVEQVLSV
jgi:hypothetical protein